MGPVGDFTVPPPSETAITTVPGRYGYPNMALGFGINYEVEVTFDDDPDLFAVYNALDFLEGALAAAWALDPQGVNEILSRSRQSGFSNPQYGPK